MPHQQAHAIALFNQGNQRLADRNLSAAASSFRQAIALNPNMGEAHANLALVLDQMACPQEAEASYRHAITLCPGSAPSHINLGSLLSQQRRFNEAGECYLQALELAPEAAAVWCNLGIWHVCQRQEEEAEQCYRRALVLEPQHAKAHFNLSYLLLRQGRFEEGWQHLETRDWYAGLAGHFGCPRWRGEPLQGKSLVIGFEAGHGDMIQFVRYAAVLKSQGAAHITLLCHPALKALLATLSGVDTIFAFNEDVPTSGWDFWTPPLSIPLYCQTREDSIPATIPYLYAEPKKQAKWAEHLAQTLSPQLRPERRDLKVGLVWRGNPQFENDSDRSIHDTSLLQPLIDVPGTQFFSLQPGLDDASVSPLRRVTHLGNHIADFTDTAAIMVNLDLVITVDTAAAHLAGALGVPCCVLLPDYLTDWRWLKDRSDSPWYPGTMRLFRQHTAGDWRVVIRAVCDEIRRKLT